MVFLARDGRADPAAPVAALRGEALGGCALRRKVEGQGCERGAVHPIATARGAERVRRRSNRNGHRKRPVGREVLAQSCAKRGL